MQTRDYKFWLVEYTVAFILLSVTRSHMFIIQICDRNIRCIESANWQELGYQLKDEWLENKWEWNVLVAVSRCSKDSQDCLLPQAAGTCRMFLSLMPPVQCLQPHRLTTGKYHSAAFLLTFYMPFSLPGSSVCAPFPHSEAVSNPYIAVKFQFCVHRIFQRCG